MEWHRYGDLKRAAEACASFIVARLEEALSGNEHATLAVSGGVTPKPMFEALAARRFPWRRVHLFWVDERAVPPTDQRSNYRLVAETLLIPAQVPNENIHRIRAELLRDAAARLYAEEIRDFFGLEPSEMPHFDVIHRGIGPDAHTASLFPGEPLIDDREGSPRRSMSRSWPSGASRCCPACSRPPETPCCWWPAPTRPKPCAPLSTSLSSPGAIPPNWLLRAAAPSPGSSTRPPPA